MTPETIGLIAMGLVFLGDIPYIIGILQGKTKPNLTSWSLWTFIWLAVLLTYRGSGAESNIWPVVASFTDNFIITLLTLRQRGGWTLPNKLEKLCIVVSTISLILYFVFNGHRELIQYALYIAILADLGATIPTLVNCFKNPEEEPPFTWICFTIGFILGIFAITEHDFANYSLLVYNAFIVGIMVIPLVLYRIRKRAPLFEWI